MKVIETALPSVFVLEPLRFGDDRGFFSESYNRQKMAEAGIDIVFVQDNHSMSSKAGTLRGLHFQSPPMAQDKLVRCGRGSLLDVAVDIRKGSPTYGKWVSEVLSFENGRQLLVPIGFLHGFITLEPNTEVVYKCSNFYAPECDGAVKWNSASLGIDWGKGEEVHLSEKDKAATDFASFDSPFTWKV